MKNKLGKIDYLRTAIDYIDSTIERIDINIGELQGFKSKGKDQKLSIRLGSGGWPPDSSAPVVLIDTELFPTNGLQEATNNAVLCAAGSIIRSLTASRKNLVKEKKGHKTALQRLLA